MASGGAQGAEKLYRRVDFSARKEYGGSGARHGRPWKDCRPIGEHRGESTGVGGKSHEPVGHALGKFVGALVTAVGMAADLPMIEDQRQRVSQQPNHRQHHQSCTLVDRGMLEVAGGGQGLKDRGIDPPSTALDATVAGIIVLLCAAALPDARLATLDSVTVAVALLEGSATLVAVTVTTCWTEIDPGTVYSPVEPIVPTFGLSDQVTAVFCVLTTLAVNC
jgi:hypothetical protein